MIDKNIKGVSGMKAKTIGNAAPMKAVPKQRQRERSYQVTPKSPNSKIYRNLCSVADEKGYTACEKCPFCGKPCQWGKEAARRKLPPKKKKEAKS